MASSIQLRPVAQPPALVDGFARRFYYLRLSLTDVCNFRCSYCLPSGYRPDGRRDFLCRDELRRVAMESIAYCEDNGITDWASIKSRVKSGLSGYLFKKTRRSPMILPIIMEV